MLDDTFHAPRDLGQACALLSELGDKGTIIAGGTDLMARFNRRRKNRDLVLVCVGKLGLDFIKEADGQVVIGACATLTKIIDSPLVREKLPLLATACKDMASPAIRNAATLGGNLVTNARNGDGIAALMALGAVAVTASTHGETKMPIEQFVVAPKKEKLGSGGIVKQFEIPSLTRADKWGWEKMKQRQGESRSILSVAARARMDGNTCTRIRLVLGAMAAHPFVSRTAAEVLEGKPFSPDLVDKVADQIISETDAGSDTRASGWYRERAARVLVRRVLNQLS
jgi:CO/xanthine dehydrogenase FAD-binding subunit